VEYTVEQVTQVQEGLLALPAVEPSKRKLDKQAAVKCLKDTIATVQERGYTLEQIAESMSGLGIQITTPTLKSYLQRAKKPSSRGAGKVQRRSASVVARREPTSAGRQAPGNASNPGPTKTAKADSVDSASKSTRSEFIATDRERL
jgi:hypothetical protein